MNPARTWIPHHRRAELRTLATRSHQSVLLAALVGGATGVMVAGFDELVAGQLLPRTLRLDPAALAFAPAAGLLVGLALRRSLAGRDAGGARLALSPATADDYLHAFHDPEHRLGPRALGVRVLAAIATVGSGAPMGLEGPSIYLGATVGDRVHHRLPRWSRPEERRTLLVAGAAAGVAAIFRAPATGAVFALEAPFQDDLARRMLLPALVGSASGYVTFVAFLGTDPLFDLPGPLGLDYTDLVAAIAIGIIAGFAARLFARGVRSAKRLANGPHPWRTTAVAGLALAAWFAVAEVLDDGRLMLTPGYLVVDWAVGTDHGTWLILALLVLRCLATVTAVAGGGAGGLFIPLVAGGALVGSAVATILGSDAADHTLLVVIGVAAFLGAGYRVPLAAVVFVAETTGRPSFVVPGLLAAVAAELVMGRASVTAYQRHPDDERPDP